MTQPIDLPQETSPIVACTISRDVQNFDLLIEDMETALGENWGDLGFDEALTFFTQPEASSLEFVAIAVDDLDEDNLPLLGDIIGMAKERGIKVILIAEDVTPAALHQLLRKGADEFVPYPLPENELQAAIDRIKLAPGPVAAAPKPGQSKDAAPAEQVERQQKSRKLTKNQNGRGVIIAVQGLAGGVGTTTMAVNLAWELANVTKENGPSVCILDFGLQYGSVSTYLDLPRRDSVFELLSDVDSADEDSFGQALMPFEDKIKCLTAPSDILPLDIVGPPEVQKILNLAQEHFDYVVVDLPNTLVQWSETVLHASQVFLAMIELDMRSAQNALRLKRALQSEDLPFEKLRFVMNRAPKFTDLQGKSRMKRMAESLGISIDLMLPDGGRAVTQACDHGMPLASSAAKNPLRREIAKLALSLHELGQSDAQAA